MWKAILKSVCFSVFSFLSVFVLVSVACLVSVGFRVSDSLEERGQETEVVSYL